MSKVDIEKTRSKIWLKESAINNLKYEIESLTKDLRIHENCRTEKVKKYFIENGYDFIQKVIKVIDEKSRYEKISFNGYTTDYSGRLVIFFIINDKNYSILYHFDSFKFHNNNRVDNCKESELEIINDFREDVTKIFDENFKE